MLNMLAVVACTVLAYISLKRANTLSVGTLTMTVKTKQGNFFTPKFCWAKNMIRTFGGGTEMLIKITSIKFKDLMASNKKHLESRNSSVLTSQHSNRQVCLKILFLIINMFWGNREEEVYP